MMTNQPKQCQKQKPSQSNITLLEMPSDNLWSEEVEQACIGSVLIGPESYYMVARLVADGQAFYLLRHQWIWKAIKHLVGNEMAVDMVTISHQLESTGQLGDIGGPLYLTQLSTNTPTSVHAETYARMVQRLYTKRQMIALGNDIKGAMDTEDSMERILARVQSKIDNTMDILSQQVIMTMADHNHDHFDASEKAREKGEILRGVPTGIPAITELIEALFPATYVVGARVHEGKTITLTTMALNAVLEDFSVAFFNCADGDLQTVLNTFYGMESGLPPAMIERRTWNDAQYQKYMDCLGRMNKLKLFITHKNGITPRDIWAQAQIIQRSHGLDMIIIDYIQEMGIDPDVRVRNEREKLMYISKALKDIRKKFNIPVVYGAQIRLDGNDDKPPRIENAQESRNIIQNADVGIALWHKIKHMPELVISVQKNKKGNHMKGQRKVGFSSVTGRLNSKL